MKQNFRESFPGVCCHHPRHPIATISEQDLFKTNMGVAHSRPFTHVMSGWWTRYTYRKIRDECKLTHVLHCFCTQCTSSWKHCNPQKPSQFLPDALDESFEIADIHLWQMHGVCRWIANLQETPICLHYLGMTHWSDKSRKFVCSLQACIPDDSTEHNMKKNQNFEYFISSLALIP